VVWVEVLHDYERHASIGRQRLKKFGVRFQPAG